VAAIEIVRAELTPRLSRELVLFGQNIHQDAATEAGVFDEAVEPDMLMEYALRKALSVAQSPRIGFVKIKRQLRREARARILFALGGDEPLYGDWLSEETLAAAAAVLDGKG
jgi:enoyl-CoA hydratase/carnithine racemase